MVHTRINEKETNPNPHINFITALPAYDDTEQEAAKQLLRALAAQIRPIMKSHGLSVNSLEEYEHNNVFAGRNWNAGETVELVLRRPDRTFFPTFWLMSTLCHEIPKLAHIKHMNHGPAFQALWRQLRTEVHALQDKGYFGDGYWSSGTRLADSSRVAGQGIELGDLPEYMCGGAQTRQRPMAKRRRTRQTTRDTTSIASNKTGRQTAKRRKAGTRVTSKNVFLGGGMTLSEEGKGKGTGFGKQASSKRAREERALATERRILGLQNETQGPLASTSGTMRDTNSASGSGSDGDDEGQDAIPETDSQRRQTLFSSQGNGNLEGLRSGTLWDYFQKDFNLNGRGDSPQQDTYEDSDTSLQSGSRNKVKRQLNKAAQKDISRDDDVISTPEALKPLAVAGSAGMGKIAQAEIDLRRKESLGMAPVKGGGRVLGTASSAKPLTLPHGQDTSSKRWTCLACTLYNEAEHLACVVCTTPRGVRN